MRYLPYVRNRSYDSTLADTINQSIPDNNNKKVKFVHTYSNQDETSPSKLPRTARIPTYITRHSLPPTIPPTSKTITYTCHVMSCHGMIYIYKKREGLCVSDRQNSARHLTCNSGLLYIRGTDREKLRDCYVTVRIGLGDPGMEKS